MGINMDYNKVAKRNQILKIRVGSHLFGTSTPESDLDYEGIFMPSKELVYGFGSCKEVSLSKTDKDITGKNTKDAIDYKIREYREFCRLALNNNPNILNILFVNNENIVSCTNYGESLLNNKHLFPHLGCLDRFIGYGHSQLHKMSMKPDNYKNLKNAAKFLKDNHPQELLINIISNSSLFKDHGPGKHLQIGDIYLERTYKVSKALKVINARLDRVSSRVVQWEEFGIDVKFASNLIQILLQGLEIIETGRLEFPLKNADLILDIKRGRYKREEIINIAGDIQIDIDLAKGVSPLPKKPRTREVESFVIQEMERWLNEK